MAVRTLGGRVDFGLDPIGMLASASTGAAAGVGLDKMLVGGSMGIGRGHWIDTERAA